MTTTRVWDVILGTMVWSGILAKAVELNSRNGLNQRKLRIMQPPKLVKLPRLSGHLKLSTKRRCSWVPDRIDGTRRRLRLKPCG